MCMIQRTPFKSLRLSACGLPVFFGVLPRNGLIFSHWVSSISYRLAIFALPTIIFAVNIIHDTSDFCKMLFDFFQAIAFRNALWSLYNLFPPFTKTIRINNIFFILSINFFFTFFAILFRLLSFFIFNRRSCV